ncbi:hypothetical protein [Emticicia aquatica]|jgi:hypothetical protein|nr:hypothetical protein [Emticicia aquatica]
MTLEKYTKKQIIFGSGGGFTNLVNEYHLLENGQLFHKKSTDSVFGELKKQKKDSVKLLFDKTKVLFDEVKDFQEPGNTYYFIKWENETSQSKIIWGASKENTPIAAKELYKELMNLVNLK